ncbi:hypothetical protein [Aquibacillus rhizosphaerae]|uniref:Uncharacterized protein n=1 Tax=Aquibacillus rhizosphaerae TaxID=3051431 RepID=A0ABT7L0U8_9BACI|nr:hypothetical protein [Aquibacillus sp. LR5S19]MDL4838969.1 hypothetical protein [Aquibacillus sp. LR5S19]
MVNVEQFAVKGKILKEKHNSNPNLRFWTQDIMDEKVYIAKDSLNDETWYRVSIIKSEVEVSEITLISNLSDFDFHI